MSEQSRTYTAAGCRFFPCPHGGQLLTFLLLLLSVYRCDTLLRLDKLALRTCVIHACLPAGLERIFLGQGALQIHLFNWTVARTVGEQYNTCAYLLTTPILPDMTHSACCLLYV